MARVLVVYHSQTGNTQKMAEAVASGVRGQGAECDLKPVALAEVSRLKEYQGLILGSPTYYGHPAAELKKFIDESVHYHAELEGKIGGAFASCAVRGGGAETTVRALLDALLVHGMVIQGNPKGGHFGPISVGAPDASALEECKALGARVARLAAGACRAG